jgi:AAA+ ATPase superfamily predicted ATPase
MATLNRNGRTLILIDEFTGNKVIPSIMQNVWDETLSQENIMLILCGSAMSFIENKILGSKNPFTKTCFPNLKGSIIIRTNTFISSAGAAFLKAFHPCRCITTMFFL